MILENVESHFERLLDPVYVHLDNENTFDELRILWAMDKVRGEISLSQAYYSNISMKTTNMPKRQRLIEQVSHD